MTQQDINDFFFLWNKGLSFNDANLAPKF